MSATDIITLIPTAIEAGWKIHETVAKYSEAPRSYEELKEFGHKIPQSILGEKLKECEDRLWEYRQHFSEDNGILETLRVLLKRLVDELRTTNTYLEKHNPNNYRGRITWIYSAEDKAKGYLKNIRGYERFLNECLGAINLRIVAAKRGRLIPSKSLALISSKVYEGFPLHISKALANYVNPHVTNSKSRKIQVLIHNISSENKARRIGQLMPSESMQVTHQRTGVLSCIGHRGYYVYFQLPDNTDYKEVKTLQSRISQTRKTPPPLEDRFDFALQLSKAVWKVYANELYHRNIRSETILSLQSTQEKTTDGSRAASEIPNQDALAARKSRDVVVAPETADRGRTGHKQGAPQSKGANVERRRSFTESFRNIRERSRNRKDDKSPDRDEKLIRRRSWTESVRNFGGASKNRKNDKSPDAKTITRRASSTKGVTKIKGGSKNRRDDKSPDREAKHKSEPITSNEDPGTVPPGAGGLYLTYWFDVRRHRDVSPQRANPIEEWWVNIYQHPQRQGARGVHTYNMGHEIYSLGVCLLEVGLWEVLVEPEPTAMVSEVLVRLPKRLPKPTKVSELLKRVLGHIIVDDTTASCLEKIRGLYIEESHARENGSQRVKSSLVRIAKEELPPKMGSVFTNLVVACLTCLDGDADDTWQGVNFTSGESVDIEPVFRTVVISVLSSIRLGPGASVTA